jgi:hypothetical protein
VFIIIVQGIGCIVQGSRFIIVGVGHMIPDCRALGEAVDTLVHSGVFIKKC